MKDANTSKTHMLYDLIICTIISGIYLLASKSRAEMNLTFMIRLGMVLWLMIVSTRGLRLLQYMATIEVDLRPYQSISLNDIEIAFKYRLREWRKYLMKPSRKALPLAIALLLVSVLHLFFSIQETLYKDILILLVFAYLTIFYLATAAEMVRFIIDISSKYNINTSEMFGQKDIIKDSVCGMLAGLPFGVCLVYFIDMPRFHYFLYFFAFSMLFSFSKLLIKLYGLFSKAVYLVVGHRFEDISLRKNS